ncbi:hypothetical protein MHBO_003372, partial [Bonamia ostreae]
MLLKKSALLHSKRLSPLKALFSSKSDFLVDLAERGNANEQYELAVNFLDGSNGFEKDTQKSRLYMAKAASQGHPEAEAHMAKLLLAGKVVKKNVREAFRHFVRSASKGHVDSMATVGHMLHEGIGVDQSSAEALRWLKKAAEKGNFRAMCDLGFIYEKKDLHVAMRLAEKAGDVEKGNLPRSQRLAGSLEAKRRNPNEALNWFLRAAEGGDVEGMSSFGRLSIQLEMAKALSLDGKLANVEKVGTVKEDRNIEKEDRNIEKDGTSKKDGTVKEDRRQNGKNSKTKKRIDGKTENALKWMFKAANRGHKGAQRDLGFLLADSGPLELERNAKKAIFYLVTAGVFGMPDAYLRAAEILVDDEGRYKGVERNEERAKNMVKDARRTARESGMATLPIPTWHRLRDDPRLISDLIKAFEFEDGKRVRYWAGDL